VSFVPKLDLVSQGPLTLVQVSSSAPQRAFEDLEPEDQARLEAAHRALRDAVEAYQRFVGPELKPGQDVPVHDIKEMAKAQEAVQTSEARLWALREELLGWSRPSWAPPATLVADWFEDDDLYDDTDASPKG
jgi:hypothetical protein